MSKRFLVFMEVCLHVSQGSTLVDLSCFVVRCRQGKRGAAIGATSVSYCLGYSGRTASAGDVVCRGRREVWRVAIDNSVVEIETQSPPVLV